MIQLPFAELQFADHSPPPPPNEPGVPKDLPSGGSPSGLGSGVAPRNCAMVFLLAWSKMRRKARYLAFAPLLRTRTANGYQNSQFLQRRLSPNFFLFLINNPIIGHNSETAAFPLSGSLS
jgi:hypothetical protein